MLPLRETQRAFAEAMVGGTHRAATAATAAMAADGLALRSVALYRRLIRNNYRQALASTYPVLLQFVGGRYFDILARGYVKAHPSISGDLYCYGQSLPAFLCKLQVAPLLVELARLEWACHEVYQAADSPPLSQDRLQALALVDPSQVTFHLHAASRLLSFPFPVHRVWQALQPDASADDVVDLPLPEEETGVVVTRGDGKVRVTPLAMADYQLLEAMARGADPASVEQMATESDPSFNFGRFMTTVLSLHVIAGLSVEQDV